MDKLCISCGICGVKCPPKGGHAIRAFNQGESRRKRIEPLTGLYE